MKQWGFAPGDYTGSYKVTFPIAFTSGVFVAFSGSKRNEYAGQGTGFTDNYTKTTMNCWLDGKGNWLAVGK